MATVRISRIEAERDLFPPICALTGVPTEAVKKKTFSWSPKWVPILILAGLIVYIVVALILTKRMTVRLPLREGKHGHWLVRQAYLIVGVLFAIQLPCVGLFLPPENETIAGIMAMFGIFLLLFVLISGLILMNRSIHPVEITNDDMRLAGVHPNFKEAFEAMREERRQAWLARKSQVPPSSAEGPLPLKARRYTGDDEIE